MSRELHRGQAKEFWSFAVLTVSDSRTEENDRGGGRIRELATGQGHREEEYSIVVDEVERIRGAIESWLDRDDLDVILVTGGTGFSPRDRTVEAVQPLFDREIAGFGELFRMLSWQQVGAAAMLSRATAGVVGRKVLLLLPGSPRAVELAMTELVLPELGHLLDQIRKT